MLATLVAVFVLFTTATATAAFVDDANNATKPIDIGVDVGAYMYQRTTSPVLVYNASVDDAGAEFLSLRFTAFSIPSSDYVVLRAMNGSVAQVYSYAMVDVSTVPFFSVPIFSNRMRLEAVARLLVNDAAGVKWCTGWLVGCQNHVLTNYHCISSQAQATMTTFDFHAYSPVCDKNVCSTAGACPGTSIVYGGELVASSQSLDYALVQLNVSIAKGNYLRLQNFTSVGGPPIYIPQHPFGQGMLVGIKTPSTGNGQVLTSSYANCGMNNLLGYMVPTAPGSSGSPIIAYSNVVVGMHACGGTHLALY
ncbi:hypothetical protein SDRG_03300 [Saprolegnia diclina VS20]|uniref:Serine protease n=1 Tax=Saprolegnia diclina (strain VS20) TaxID=1156394 RepID=T0S8W8_SAPDV|nr:hypothetical protein SDRG_03300 [Saprolegnia diclina VS20]EQC39092.1 hypothetical protein SDRG_03300 [Saprolegnia diclina VS20]|eukprot:XP_008607153.1 hypothetical protein SDRG_03300 [Saprolegnia diclina VS20]